MKVKVTIKFELDTDEYNYDNRHTPLDHVNAMMQGLADFPKEHKIDVIKVEEPCT